MPTTITVSFLSHLASIAGHKTLPVQINGRPTVAALLDTLKTTLGDAFTRYCFTTDGSFSDNVVMLINGLNLKQLAPVTGDPLSAILSASDDVTFIVPFGGG